jgi:opacity protein-like surface antigen
VVAAPFATARLPVTTATTDGAFGTGHTDGELLGGQAGCNYQLKPGIVIGIEASGTFDWAKDTFTTELVTGATRTHVTNETTEIERKCQVHLGPRLGATLPGLTGNGETLALAPLIYATGGYAGTCYRSKQSGDNGRFRTTVNNPDVSESDFISGWFVGAGVDIPTSGFIPGTFVQIEYSHSEYGDMTFRLAGSDVTGRLDNNSNEIRVGFKYRFPVPTPTPLPVPR